jgi:uncharacterized protein (TIGR02757 family)
VLLDLLKLKNICGSQMKREKLFFLLEQAYKRHNKPDFIANDPISIPHSFSKKQDIEISAFWISMIAWGNRKSIITSGKRLMELMDNAPHQFITQHQENDLRRFENFKHRTFNYTDTLYFIEFFKQHYQNHESLETAFSNYLKRKDQTTENALIGFHNYFFSLEDAPQRTKKHVATPLRNSSCKRLNMYLRWMIRESKSGIDFGLWKKIKPAQLLCPLDVHVDNTARKLGLLHRKQTDWQAVLELTDALRTFDPIDPVKYDLALFGMGESKSLHF